MPTSGDMSAADDVLAHTSQLVFKQHSTLSVYERFGLWIRKKGDERGN
jgi:hypothetical protein